MGDEGLQIKVTLNEEEKKRFDTIKAHYGLRTDAETIRLVLKKEFERLEKK